MCEFLHSGARVFRDEFLSGGAQISLWWCRIPTQPAHLSRPCSFPGCALAIKRGQIKANGHSSSAAKLISGASWKLQSAKLQAPHYILKIVSLPEIRGGKWGLQLVGKGFAGLGCLVFGVMYSRETVPRFGKAYKKNLSRDTKLHVKKIPKLIHI